jgi:indoleamine 2,3-dioxygenase
MMTKRKRSLKAKSLLLLERRLCHHLRKDGIAWKMMVNLLLSGFLSFLILSIGNFSAAEYPNTRRSPYWLRHPTWTIPTLEREKVQYFSGIDDILSLLKQYDVSPQRGFLPDKDPIQRLPHEKYYIWEDLADDLPKLLSARLGQVREPLSRLPIVTTDELTTVEELRRAHLLLCLFAHAFVWGGTPVMEYIPKGIAIPLWEVSCRLDVPPVLMNMSITLYNWRRLDPTAGLNMMNLATINNFFNGRDESWFYLITVEIEAKGAGSIVPLLQINNDIKRAISTPAANLPGGIKHIVRNVILLEMITSKLLIVAECIDKMCESMSATREGCHPFIFYHRVRPFLAGWKSNPAVPNGVKYEGIQISWADREDRRSPASMIEPKRWQGIDRKATLETCSPQFFSGGSAAQSALLPFLDICLGVDHTEHDKSSNSAGFLRSMRQYMPRQHREFLELLEQESCIRQFMVDCQRELIKEHLTKNIPIPKTISSEQLVNEVKSELSEPTATEESESADPSLTSEVPWTWRGEGGVPTAVTALDGLDERAFDSLHRLCDAYDSCLKGLAKFRTVHISIVAEYILAQQRQGYDKQSIEGNAGGKGTGGTDLMNFLKPIRDNCNVAVLKSNQQSIDK